MDSLAAAFPVRIPFWFLVLKTMEKKKDPVSNMFFFYVFFFLIHLATAMETDTGISSLSINMTPWWFSKWIFFFLDIFWVCLYALFCFVYYSFFVCFCILRKTNTVLAQNEFLNKGQRKGKATLGCWASV